MGIRKHIPNAITSLNLLCGVIGIIACCEGSFDYAFYFMLAAVVFDFCDGLAARLLGAYSPVGKELDSLADVVSFGVLPSLMLSKSMYYDGSALRMICCALPLLLAVFSALRLAKFNLDERQHGSFLGLPTPASALICASLVCLVGTADKASALGRGLSHLADSFWFYPLIALALCALLVSEVPMFSFKFGKDTHSEPVVKMKRTAIVSIAVIIVAVVLLLGWHWSAIVLLTLLSYVLMNLIFALFKI